MGIAKELLCYRYYFEVHRMLVNTERIRNMAEVGTDDLSFCTLLCYKGCDRAFTDDNVIRICKEDCIFPPANSSIQINGRIVMLGVSC